MDRRRFVVATAATAVSLRSYAQGSPETSRTATLTLHSDQPGAQVPANFIGLSYETQQLSDPSFFTAKNTGLLAQFRALAPHGVLRLGGNTSDVGWWKPTPASQQPPLPANVFIAPSHPNERPFQKLAFSITPEAVINLRGFLDATGWTCLYGINLGSSTPARAAEEAVFVAKTLGPKLEYFQLGNEPNLFSTRFREKATWTADKFFDDWLASANAIRAVVPSARFGLPDVVDSGKWIATVTARLIALSDRPSVEALSHHYYFSGPPSSPNATLERLLQTDMHVDRLAENARTNAEKLHVHWRMTEGNTCFRGGKPGMSDVFGAALWAADYALRLAALGYAGVNLHGGGGKAVADSLGGTLPGELLMPDPKAPHPRPFYTPIAFIDDKYVAEPVYYGLQFAQHFAGTTVVGLDFDPGAVNATAYAAKTKEGDILAIINKDETQDLHLALPRGFNPGRLLTAASLTSTTITMTQAKPSSATLVPHGSAVLYFRPNA